MATIWIAIWQDRHSDTTAHPFVTFEEAKAFCDQKAQEMAKRPEYIEYQDIFEYFVQYSCESDCLWVTKHSIHGWELVESLENRLD